MTDAIQALDNQRRAAQALRESLKGLGDDDLTRDMIEGETGLHEAIAALFAEVTETEVQLAGLEAKLTEFEGRKKRYQDRLGFMRSVIEQAMLIGDVRKLELPDATLSLSSRGAKLVITDESAVPADYWRPKDPELDRKALAQALKDKIEIPGVALDNGGISLTVRRA